MEELVSQLENVVNHYEFEMKTIQTELRIASQMDRLSDAMYAKKNQRWNELNTKAFEVCKVIELIKRDFLIPA